MAPAGTTTQNVCGLLAGGDAHGAVPDRRDRLPQPKMPDIPTTDEFRGSCTCMRHSGDDLPRRSPKWVAAVGTGSTGVQPIPSWQSRLRPDRLPVHRDLVLPKMDFGFAPAVQSTFAKRPPPSRSSGRTTDNFTDLLVLIAMWKASATKPDHQFACVESPTAPVRAAAGQEGAAPSPRTTTTLQAVDPCRTPTTGRSTSPTCTLETAGIDRIEADGVGVEGRR